MEQGCGDYPVKKKRGCGVEDEDEEEDEEEDERELGKLGKCIQTTSARVHRRFARSTRGQLKFEEEVEASEAS